MTVPPDARPSRSTVVIPTPWSHLFVKADFTPRETFSASQLETAECKYSWGLSYLLGLRTAEPLWYDATGRDISETLNAREKSLAFGTALHSKLESHFRGQATDWTDDVGQRALVGLHLLPQAPPVYVESSIALDTTQYDGGLEPLVFNGYIDLDQPPQSNHLGGDDGTTYDYKSTGNFRWIKTPAQLKANLAACLYLESQRQKYGLSVRRGRWVYFGRVGKPEARPVDFSLTRDEAAPVIRVALGLAHQLRTEVREFRLLDQVGIADEPRIQTRLALIDHLPKNLAKCKAYSGCPMHFSAGGPCTAETTPGILGSQLAQVAANIGDVTEPKTTAQWAPQGQHNMASLAERLAAGKASPPAAPAPVGANPFPPAPVAPAQAAAFNPGAAAFPAVGATPPVAPPLVDAGASMPATWPAQPAAPVLAPTAAAAPFAGFPAPGAPAQAALPAAPPFGAAPAWAGVNPPESALAAPGAGPLAPVPPVTTPAAASGVTAPAPARRTRRTKAQIEADNAALAAAGQLPPTHAPAASYGLLTFTIRVIDETGCAIEMPCPADWAELLQGELGPVFGHLAG